MGEEVKKTKKSKSSSTKKSTKKKSVTKKTPIKKSTSKKDKNNKKIELTKEEIKNEELDDLIITRELKLNLDNIKDNEDLLREIKSIVEEDVELGGKNEKYLEDYLDLDSIDESLLLANKQVKKKNNIWEKFSEMYKNHKENINKKKRKGKISKEQMQKILSILCVIMIVILLLILGFYFLFSSLKESNMFDFIKDFSNKTREVDLRPQLYEDCLKRAVDPEEPLDERLIKAQEELSTYLKNNYRTSVMYEDLNFGYKYEYNTQAVYYAASTIKLLDALYIFTKAAKGEINLEDKMVYTSNFHEAFSAGMQNYKNGDEVTIRNLVKYALEVSDNTAHKMLVSYIGYNNLREFGKSLGAKYTLATGDNFGSITTTDAIIYIKEINKFINENGELGKELQSYLLAADQNDLAIESEHISAAHKYGSYGTVYHNIGIVYAENPYLVAILTNENKNDYETIVKDINNHIYSYHKLVYEVKENNCHLEVYGS